MKGGKDMEKVYRFYFNEKSYNLKEDEKDIFCIPADTLEFNGNEFYQNIYKDFVIGDNIKIVNNMEENDMKKDHFAQYIFEMLQTMTNEIEKRLKEKNI